MSDRVVVVRTAQVVTVAAPGPQGLPGEPGPQGPPGDASQAVSEQQVQDMIGVHVIEPEPHPAYDDIQSLVLLFENRLV